MSPQTVPSQSYSHADDHNLRTYLTKTEVERRGVYFNFVHRRGHLRDGAYWLIYKNAYRNVKHFVNKIHTKIFKSLSRWLIALFLQLSQRAGHVNTN